MAERKTEMLTSDRINIAFLLRLSVGLSLLLSSKPYREAIFSCKLEPKFQISKQPFPSQSQPQIKTKTKTKTKSNSTPKSSSLLLTRMSHPATRTFCGPMRCSGHVPLPSSTAQRTPPWRPSSPALDSSTTPGTHGCVVICSVLI